MQIEEVKPEQRVEGFVRKFDVADFRDIELNPGAAPPVSIVPDCYVLLWN